MGFKDKLKDLGDKAMQTATDLTEAAKRSAQDEPAAASEVEE